MYWSKNLGPKITKSKNIIGPAGMVELSRMLQMHVSKTLLVGRLEPLFSGSCYQAFMDAKEDSRAYLTKIMKYVA